MHLSIRFTEDEHREVERAAKAAGIAVSEWRLGACSSWRPLRSFKVLLPRMLRMMADEIESGSRPWGARAPSARADTRRSPSLGALPSSTSNCPVHGDEATGTRVLGVMRAARRNDASVAGAAVGNTQAVYKGVPTGATGSTGKTGWRGTDVPHRKEPLVTEASKRGLMIVNLTPHPVVLTTDNGDIALPSTGHRAMRKSAGKSFRPFPSKRATSI